jgi:hypothetical protein
MINVLWVKPYLDRIKELTKPENLPLSPLVIEAYVRNKIETNWKLIYFNTNERNFKFPDFYPDIICFSVYSAENKDSIMALYNIFNKKYENSLFIIGGWIYPYHVQRYRFFDGGLIGDGEVPFLELLQSFKISKIKAIEYMENSPYWFTKNKLNTKFYHYKKEDENTESYLDSSLLKEEIMLPYNISYNCNNACSFCICAQNPYIHWYRDISFVKREMLYQKSKGIRHYSFHDRSFLSNREYCKELFLFMKENNIKGYVMFANFDDLTKELLYLYKQICPVSFFVFSPDADCDKTLRFAKKTGKYEYLIELVKYAKDIGFTVAVISLIGYPQQTNEDLDMVEENMMKLDADTCVVSDIQISEFDSLAKIPKNYDDAHLREVMDKLSKNSKFQVKEFDHHKYKKEEE